MAKGSGKQAGEPKEIGDLLHEELKRRGMSEAEIETVFSKRRRRETAALNAVRLQLHAMEPSPHPEEELLTVELAASHMKLHPKTILRFIHEGRLKAARVGKSYRIVRKDLDAFAGVPGRAEAPVPEAWVTSIVDIPNVGAELAQTWSRTIMSALAGHSAGRPPLRADVVHEPHRAHLRIVVSGAPRDTVNLLGLISVWLEQLR